MPYLMSTKRFGVGADDTTANAPDTEIDMGEFSLTADDFNCTKYPGVCKPTNLTALSRIRELQMQMNRVAQLRGVAKIGVDGDVGPGTIKLYSTLQGVSVGSINAITIATSAPYESKTFMDIADAAGIPTTVPQPAPATQPSIINTTTGLEIPVPTPESSGVVAAFSGMSTAQKVIFAGLLGGVGLLVAKEFGKKKKGPSVSIRRYR